MAQYIDPMFFQNMTAQQPMASRPANPAFWPMTPTQFYSGLGGPEQSALGTFAPQPLGQFTQVGQELATAGKFRTEAKPSAPFKLPVTPFAFDKIAPPPEIPEIPQEFGYHIPGGGPGPVAPVAPGMADLSGKLTAPTKREIDPLANLMQAIGTANWQQNVSTGTNLFNIGAAMMGGLGATKEEAADAQKEYEDAMRKFELEKLSLQTGTKQQSFENQAKLYQLQLAETKAKGLRPTISDGQLVYGVPTPDGGMDVTVKKIAKTKDEQKMDLLKEMQGMTQVDLTGSLMGGQVPAQYAEVLMPRMLQIQQQIMTGDAAGQLAMLDDVTKRRTINAMTNMLMRQDPELAPLISALEPNLQAMETMRSALK